MHFGIISPPVSGHIHPMGALGRELISRGHRATLLHMEDVRGRALQEGLEFLNLGNSDHPAGSLPISLDKLGKLDGLAALRFTIDAVQKTTEMFCRDGPEALRGAGVGMLLVDQTEPCGASLAEYIGIPFVTVVNALLINREDSVPPPFTGWKFAPSWWTRIRNRVGYRAGNLVTRPIWNVVSRYRRIWGLPPVRDPASSFSQLAQLCQMPVALDYPRMQLPNSFHYLGPFRRDHPKFIPFPWERLDGRQLIYASLGTLQNSREDVFRCFGDACQGLNVQLVISHGHGLTTERAASLSRDAIVVPYAPQAELLKHAALTITHAGLNTVLDSLASGVPLVAIPITYEQPAIAERLRWSGAGLVIPFPDLTVHRLRAAIQKILAQKSFAQKARRIAASIREAGGTRGACDIIEGLRPPRT